MIRARAARPAGRKPARKDEFVQTHTGPSRHGRPAYESLAGRASGRHQGDQPLRRIGDGLRGQADVAPQEIQGALADKGIRETDA